VVASLCPDIRALRILMLSYGIRLLLWGRRMRYVFEFFQTNSCGERELIEIVHREVNSIPHAKMLAASTMKHTKIRGRIADFSEIKDNKGRLICVVDPGADRKSTLF
jgi:hypothetical protein